MSERHRLSVLHMRKARHDRLRVTLGKDGKRLNEMCYSVLEFGNRPFEIQPFVKRNLIVSASARMHFFTRFSDPVGERGFYKRVDVFSGSVDGKLARFHVGIDRIESGNNRIGFLTGNDARTREHLSVRFTSENIIRSYAGVCVN